jgi:hypothetical protein
MEGKLHLLTRMRGYLQKAKGKPESANIFAFIFIEFKREPPVTRSAHHRYFVRREAFSFTTYLKLVQHLSGLFFQLLAQRGNVSVRFAERDLRPEKFASLKPGSLRLRPTRNTAPMLARETAIPTKSGAYTASKMGDNFFEMSDHRALRSARIKGYRAIRLQSWSLTVPALRRFSNASPCA